MRVALLGDSTLDNGRYTEGGPPVRDHLAAGLGASASVTLLAVDGHTTRDIPEQMARLPSDTTHLVLSVGGNDALGHVDILRQPARSVSEALLRLDGALEQFGAAYRSCLKRVLEVELPTLVCTIYNGAFPYPEEQRVVSTAVRLFDDVIVQAASDAGCSILDLRRVCSESEDYWNPIEPGERGGAKIAKAIHRILVGDDPGGSVLHAGPGKHAGGGERSTT